MAYYYSPFRKKYKKKPVDTGGVCAFCDKRNISRHVIKDTSGVSVENDSYTWIINLYPKFEGHTMLVPKRHITTIGEETTQEVLDREEIMVYASRVLQKLFPQAGIEMFLQTGAGSESSIAHLHWHIVPASPTDPLRSFDKLGHFYTVDEGKEKIVLFPIRIKRSPKQLLSALSKIAPKRKR